VDLTAYAELVSERTGPQTFEVMIVCLIAVTASKLLAASSPGHAGPAWHTPGNLGGHRLSQASGV
jgi:hypothetical protein